MNELVDFENALRKKYSCEAEFSHSKIIQQIINICHFNLIHLLDMFKPFQYPYEWGSKSNFERSSLHFNLRVDSSIAHFEGSANKKLRFVYCTLDKSSTTPYLFIFHFHREQEYYQHICKFERVKAFL